MNKDLFEQLLYEEESTTLDFKRDQYRFVHAAEDEKSELLKDILGFANAWRRSEAYILIGVKDVRGGRANVIGISATDHLNDHSLQQFVNNSTNQPVRFHYEAFGYEGKQVGIICIDEQTRPIYLKHDYGKLEKEKVYVRRGSSTDPTKPATLEEIAQMRIGSGQPTAELLIEFADYNEDDALGTDVCMEAEFWELPERIPDYSPEQRMGSFGFNAHLQDYMNFSNTSFFRDLAEYESMQRLYRPLRLMVKNKGSVSANNVIVELSFPKENDVIVLNISDMPERPKKHMNILDFSPPPLISRSHRDVGEIQINENGNQFWIDFGCGDLQPGRRVFSDVFLIGKRTSGEVHSKCTIFADNLPSPKDVKLTISAKVKTSAISLDDLYAISKHEYGIKVR